MTVPTRSRRIYSIMSAISCALLLLTAQPGTAAPRNALKVPAVVGGNSVPITSVPWQVWVTITTRSGEFACGGSILNRQWVITAGHCVTDGRKPAVATAFHVYTGTSTLGGNSPRSVSVVYRHKNYNPDSISNDVALLKLTTPLTLGAAQQAVTLPFDKDPTTWPADNTDVVVSGWGRTVTGGSLPHDLQSATLTVMGSPTDDSQCGEWSANNAYNPAQNLCAGSDVGIPDICQGDSGGPYVVTEGGVHYLAGITSFNSNFGCAVEGWPGIAVRVTSFLNWFSPPIPTGLTWSRTASTYTLKWTASKQLTAAAISAYRVETSLDGGSSWTTAPVVTTKKSTVKISCSAGPSCDFRVAPLNPVNETYGPYRYENN